MLDFNRVNISASSVSVGINEAIERAALRSIRQPRSYLGASIVGHECLRRVQYDWFCDPVHAARTYEIFERGHYFEQRSRQHLVDVGFHFAPSQALAFSAADGLLRGHADGIIIAGPDLPGLYLIYPLIWEHKALGAKGWKRLERDGLSKAFPEYAAQVALYQAYLDVTNPALFTALNADTCERLSKLKAADDRDTFGWSLIPVTRPYLVETLSQTKLQRPISLAKARRRSGRLAGHRAQRPAEGGL